MAHRQTDMARRKINKKLRFGSVLHSHEKCAFTAHNLKAGVREILY